MSEKTISDRALDLYKPPFRYEGGYIWDAESNMVADDIAENAILRVCGRRRISYLKNPEQLQDAVGKHIAKALTQYWEAEVSLR